MLVAPHSWESISIHHVESYAERNGRRLYMAVLVAAGFLKRSPVSPQEVDLELIPNIPVLEAQFDFLRGLPRGRLHVLPFSTNGSVNSW